MLASRYTTVFGLLLVIGMAACKSLPAPAKQAEGALAISLTHRFEPSHVFLNGEVIPLALRLFNEGDQSLQSVPVEIKLPSGSSLRDTSWIAQDQDVSRTVPQIMPGEQIVLGLFVGINANCNDSPLTFLAKTGTQSDQLEIPLGTAISTSIDTCSNFKDSSKFEVITYLSTQRNARVNLCQAIEFGPTRPLRVSAGNCPVLKLDQFFKSEQKKDKCSCLSYTFTANSPSYYPDRYVPTGKALKGCHPSEAFGQKGDTITFSIRSLEGKSFAGISINDQEGNILASVYDSPLLDYEYILGEDSSTFHIHLQANRRFKVLPSRQYAILEVERKPAAIERSLNLKLPGTDSQNLTSRTLSRKLLKSTPDSTIWSHSMANYYQGKSILFHLLESQDTTNFIFRRDTLSSDTCWGTFQIDSTAQKTFRAYRAPIDTLLYNVTEAAFEVVGARNPLGVRQGNIEVKVPLSLKVLDAPVKDELVALAYWIGVGERPLSDYLALAEETPAEWTQPGVSPPLAAYGLGKPIVLPSLQIGETLFRKKHLQYDFITSGQRNTFRAGKGYRPLIGRKIDRPNFGIIRGEELAALRATTRTYNKTDKQEILHFFLAYRNRHEVNTYPLQLKVVAYYQVSEPREEWVDSKSQQKPTE